MVREGLGRMKNDKADAKVTTNRDESWHSLAAHDVILIAFGWVNNAHLRSASQNHREDAYALLTFRGHREKVTYNTLH